MLWRLFSIRRCSPVRRLLPVLVCLLMPGMIAGCGNSAAETEAAANAAPLPVEDMYNNALDAVNQKRYATAVAQFDRVEQTYPYSTWAVNAQLMQGYAQYQQNNYTDAIGTLNRFIQLHPVHRDIAYVYYLRALCYYEQIADVQRDQKGTEQALLAMKDVVNRFPESAYARDASLKIDLARDHLAGKEMEIGRWYERQHLYAASIGRYQNVVDNYQTTNHVQEALYRLTEIYLKLGLADQARKTASVLGYNYPGSEWYQNGYDALLDNRLVTETSPRPANVQQAPTAGDTDNPPPPPGFFSRAWHAVF